MKKILLLGGSRYLLPVIERIHKLGYYAITCDYFPDNIAHKYSDEYCNISVIDKEAVLQTAKRLNVNGIMAFACDPGVVTAAYVAEKLSLPSCGTYESVCILQNKARFRKFLKEHGFNAPKAKGYTSVDEALEDLKSFQWPVVIKPTDSAGSKGVIKVDVPEKLEESIRYALSFSHRHEFIIEEFLESKGYSSDADSFSVDGKLKVVSFSSQRFDKSALNPYTPSAYSWPATISDEHQKELILELQRLVKLLKMKTSIYNIEVRECTDGKAYIMEMSPRGGGNRLAEMLQFSTGIDLITNAIRAAVGDTISEVEQKQHDGNWAEIILHSNDEGIFDSLWISDLILPYVVEKDLWIHSGDKVERFSGAHNAIGTLVLKFDKQEKLQEVLAEQNKYIEVKMRRK